jgi:hypothetical protein
MHFRQKAWLHAPKMTQAAPLGRKNKYCTLCLFLSQLQAVERLCQTSRDTLLS